MLTREKTILLVDSDQDMCWLMHKVLKDLACQVCVSHSWNKTLELLDRQDFDLVLLDMPLTNFSGTKVVEAVQSKKPQTPIIVILSLRSDGMLRRFNDLGIHNFIDKPFVIEQLVDRVKKALYLNN